MHPFYNIKLSLGRHTKQLYTMTDIMILRVKIPNCISDNNNKKKKTKQKNSRVVNVFLDNNVTIYLRLSLLYLLYKRWKIKFKSVIIRAQEFKKIVHIKK